MQQSGNKNDSSFHLTFNLTIVSDLGFLRICGEDPNFSILEVENTELCLTPQTGEALYFKIVDGKCDIMN